MRISDRDEPMDGSHMLMFRTVGREGQAASQEGTAACEREDSGQRAPSKDYHRIYGCRENQSMCEVYM